MKHASHRPTRAYHAIVSDDGYVYTNGRQLTFGPSNPPSGTELVAWRKQVPISIHDPVVPWACCPVETLAATAAQLVETGLNDLGMSIPRQGSPGGMQRVATQRPGLLAVLESYLIAKKSLDGAVSALPKFGVRGRAEMQSLLMVSIYRTQALRKFIADAESTFYCSPINLMTLNSQFPHYA
jgi:hypothetical protein